MAWIIGGIAYGAVCFCVWALVAVGADADRRMEAIRERERND